MSIFSFLNDNLSKYQWIVTKLGMCVYIVEIWSGIVNGQYLSINNEYMPEKISIFSFQDNNLCKSQWIITKLDMCIDIVEIWFEITKRQILSILVRVICPRHDNGGVLSFHVFIYTVSLGLLSLIGIAKVVKNISELNILDKDGMSGANLIKIR